ncbi:molybdopterin-dependent oxidoreductase, partial [Chloroflexota bacterium]
FYTAPRLFNMFGGCTELWGDPCVQGLIFASQYTFGFVPEGPWGSPANANESDDLLNSRLIIIWGQNPKDTIQGTGTFWYIAQAKKDGCKIVSVDTIYNNTAKTLNTPWIPIRPGTDTAMLAAMAYVIITENLQDQPYLDRYTVGFEIFKDYILGAKDGIPKTPKWAENITGVPASTIEDLARMYATTKPSALIQGMGPSRTAFGEQYHRMVITLEAMTGNIGIHGGSAGGFWGYPIRMGNLPVDENPITISIKRDKWADCILMGKTGGYPTDIKMMYIVGTNALNHIENTNKSVKALKKVESIVVHEQFMTPTARFADIILPVTTHFERNDIYLPFMKGRYAIYSHKITEPMYECKSDLEIFTELANRLGIPDYNTKSEDEWLRSFVGESDIPDYDEFKRKGFHKFELKEPWIAFKKQIEDSDNNPFPTPSGKIEIYSETLAKMDFKKSQYGGYIPPIPEYVPVEDTDSPLVKKYPLQLVTPHHKYRTNSIYHNTKSLRKLYTHEVWVNTKDANERDIKNGDTVRVFNDIGTIIIKAKVTERIMPGVVAVYQGTYYDPDENGVDRGGCANVLTKDEPSPSGTRPYNSSRIQLEACFRSDR